MLDWLAIPRLRPLIAVLGLSGLLTLAACGGGSGAPNNPYDPVPSTPVLTVAPSSLTAYSGVPATVAITSGAAPFFAYTSNATVLPVAQNVAGSTIVLLPNKVSADTDVTLTVQDSASQSRLVTVSVKAAPIFNSFTFVPSGGDCGTNLCSGQTGTATVVATGPGGAPLVSRPIRFDVVFGPFGIATSDPATSLVPTWTVATDATGTAVVGVRAFPDATTQPAQIRATDVTSGQQQIANFTVVNNTIGGQSPITVIPATATITGALTTSCSTGFEVDYYIYGGSPPYSVSSTFPASVVLVNSTVALSGGFFGAITNGACVDPLTFTIVDSAGKQTTAALINKPGTTAPPTPSALAVTPPPVVDIGCITATGGKTYTFIVSGGTPPYNVSSPVANPPLPSGDTVVSSPSIVSTSGESFAVTFAGTSPPSIAGTVVNILIGDAGTPQLTTTTKITCN